MRASDLAFSLLILRSRFAVNFPQRQRVCRPGRAKADESIDRTRTHILVLDPASPEIKELGSARYQVRDFYAVDFVGLANMKNLADCPPSVVMCDLQYERQQVTTAHGMSNDELEQVLPAYDAVVVRSANRITRSMLVSSPRVAIVGRAGSGVDNIDLEAASELGVPVVNAPTGNAGSVAELVVGLMLGVSRSIPSAHDTMRDGKWAKKDFVGRTLNGQTLGIVGFGSVGQALARLAVAFGMVVIIAEGSRHESDRHASSKAAAAREAGVTLPPLPLDVLLPKCDFLSLHCPLTVDTRGLISGRELTLMKPSAVVVNAARGGVVDERALLQSLEEERLGGAALDAFDQEKLPLQDHVVSLCRLPNVLCTPHIGGSTEEAGARVLSEVCGAIIDFLEGSLPPSRIINGSPDPDIRLARLRGTS